MLQLGEKYVNMRVMRKRLFGRQKMQIIIGYQSRAISKGTLLQSIRSCMQSRFASGMFLHLITVFLVDVIL